jgi:hypothetical protein
VLVGEGWSVNSAAPLEYKQQKFSRLYCISEVAFADGVECLAMEGRGEEPGIVHRTQN